MVDHSEEGPPVFPGSEDERRRAGDEFREMCDRVTARVIHLHDFNRIALERAVRILRAFFVVRRHHAPRQGTLHALMLVGDPADTNRPMMQPGRERPDFEIWAFVDHEAYKGMDQHWGEARRILVSEVGHFATFTLSVLATAEAARFRLTNRFLAERYDRGLILYDRGMDPPRDAQAQAVHDRIMAAVDALPDRERAAFRCYRKHGFDMAAIADRLGVRPVEAELHLSEASGRMISTLKDDAHARSLRPGIGDHPRHNLDLFHRPGDRDRLLAIPGYDFARNCVESMTHAAERDRPFMVVNQAAYAAEFALKSVLLRAGYSDDWNRTHIGLDTDLALREALACGLPSQPPEVECLIERLARYHEGRRTHDEADGALAVMPAPGIVKAIRGLFHSVGQMTGYYSLPAEEVRS